MTETEKLILENQLLLINMVMRSVNTDALLVEQCRTQAEKTRAWLGQRGVDPR